MQPAVGGGSRQIETDRQTDGQTVREYTCTVTKTLPFIIEKAPLYNIPATMVSEVPDEIVACLGTFNTQSMADSCYMNYTVLRLTRLYISYSTHCHALYLNQFNMDQGQSASSLQFPNRVEKLSRGKEALIGRGRARYHA